MKAGMGQINHSAAGPNLNTIAQPNIPSAIPNRNNISMKGIMISPYDKNDRWKIPDASNSITTKPMILVSMLDETSPARYSDIDSGEANILRKLRDQTSSKKAMVTPCITRVRKFHNNTAPSRLGTKSYPVEVKLLRYLVMNPHRIISTATHANKGMMRATLLFIR